MNDLTAKINELENMIVRQDISISDLGNKLKDKSVEAAGFKDQMQKKSDEIEQLEERNKASDNEISQLEARLKDQERRLYSAGRMILRLVLLITNKSKATRNQLLAALQEMQMYKLSKCSLCYRT